MIHLTRSITSFAVCLQLPLAVSAQETPELKPGVPVVDTTPGAPAAGSKPDATGNSVQNASRRQAAIGTASAGQPSTATASVGQASTGTVTEAHGTTMLNGAVHRNVSADSTNNETNTGTANVDAPKTANVGLQSQAAATDISATPGFKLTLQKLAAKVKLTADDYRALGIGVLGYESTRQFLWPAAQITELYDGCPAKEAGIKVGDWELASDEFDAQTDQHGLTKFICGLAGKPVTLTIKHHGHILYFHLIRMNMEDIPNDHLRRTYEHLVMRMRSKLLRAYPQLNLETLGSERVDGASR